LPHIDTTVTLGAGRIMPKFTVKTLDERGLQAAAHALGALVQQDFQPNIIIGVRTGGFVVAGLMTEALPIAAIMLPMTCRRPSTGKKQRFAAVKTMLMAMPDAVTDRLRVLEHKMLTQRQPPQAKTDFIPDAAELAQLTHLLALRGDAAKILVIDDAVDSGATLLAVTETIRRVMAPDAELRTAAITVTTPNPLIQPDYVMYRYVLCRFPWSLDFKAAAACADLRPRRHGAGG
jgi:uncharacterized protein